MEISIIEIWWHGPFSIEHVKEHFNSNTKDYGLYQIYGTHAIYGPNSLLYIGKANHQTFATGLTQQTAWTAHLESSIEYYIGLFGSTKNIGVDEWSKQIDDAERLLIYFCTPPYNSSGIVDYGLINNTIVLNFDKKNRLPYEVSTFYDESEWWSEEWKEFRLK